MKQLDHRRRLIDSFINAIYLFDDKLVITFNYKEGTKTITFAEIEEVFGSDLSLLSVGYFQRFNYTRKQRTVQYLSAMNGSSFLMGLNATASFCSYA